MISNFFILIFSYFIITLSILGYGSLIFRIIYKNNFREISIGFLGLYGIFFLICYSYLSHFFIAHSVSHNLFILIIGLLFFLFSIYFFLRFKKNYNLKFIFLNIIFLSLASYIRPSFCLFAIIKD